MADEFGDDEAFSAAFREIDTRSLGGITKQPAPSTTGQSPAKVQQLKPQALPSRSGPSSILVSIRQKGNPILSHIQGLPWEYTDTVADYVVGATTCALFLSLKYHRLHPEYIYGRIKTLGKQYNLRVLLTMVDIDNHEEPLRELAKTSMINDLTLMLCWSAKEAARYLEAYKTLEHVGPGGIKTAAATTYREQFEEFITIPRSINKTDALGLVSAFGSVRAAVNAEPEDILNIGGWGQKKIEQWCKVVREPFRVGRTRKVTRSTPASQSTQQPIRPIGLVPTREASHPESSSAAATSRAQHNALSSRPVLQDPDSDEEQALLFADLPSGQAPSSTPPKRKRDEELNDGVASALAKLRQPG